MKENIENEGGFSRREFLKTLGLGTGLIILTGGGCLFREEEEKTVGPERDFPLGKLWPQKDLFPEGWKGLTYFPDGQFSTLYNKDKNKVFAFLAAENYGVMLQGPTLEKAKQVDVIIRPSGGEAFDAHYAGPGSVNSVGQEILMFYHGEYQYFKVDPKKYPRQGEYHAGIGLSQFKGTDKLGKASFAKLGQILSSPYPRPEQHDPFATGVGQPSVLLDKEGKNLLCFYVEWPLAGSAYIAAARCPVEKAASLDGWRKFDGQGFNEPGLLGKAAPVIEMKTGWAGMPSVSFNEYLGKYLAVFNSQDGFYTTTSENGTVWEKPSLILAMEGVTNLPEVGKPFIMYPSLLSERMNTGRTGKEMSLVYAYTPKHPNYSHSTVSRKVVLGE